MSKIFLTGSLASCIFVINFALIVMINFSSGHVFFCIIWLVSSKVKFFNSIWWAIVEIFVMPSYLTVASKWYITLFSPPLSLSPLNFLLFALVRNAFSHASTMSGFSRDNNNNIFSIDNVICFKVLLHVSWVVILACLAY